MKKYFLTTTLVLIAILFSRGQSTEKELRVQDLAKRKFQWMLNKQVDSLAAVLDDRLKYIHSNGSVQTRDDVLADLKSGKLTYQSIDIREMETRVFENAAVVTGKGKFSGNSPTAAFAVDLLFTEVYVWKNKGWRLVSRHASKLP